MGIKELSKEAKDLFPGRGWARPTKLWHTRLRSNMRARIPLGDGTQRFDDIQPRPKTGRHPLEATLGGVPPQIETPPIPLEVESCPSASLSPPNLTEQQTLGAKLLSSDPKYRLLEKFPKEEKAQERHAIEKRTISHMTRKSCWEEAPPMARGTPDVPLR
ncbi:hypothetical protein ACLOJK_006463 [Asimina triloba]